MRLILHIRRPLIGLSVLLAAGCGGADLPTPVPVTGRVTQVGKPVAGATIGFSAIGPELPARYRYIAATTDDSGMFELDAVYPTEYMVSVSKTADAPPVLADAAAAPATANSKELAKYGDNSPLRATVTPDQTSFEFDLK